MPSPLFHITLKTQVCLDSGDDSFELIHCMRAVVGKKIAVIMTCLETMLGDSAIAVYPNNL